MNEPRTSESGIFKSYEEMTPDQRVAYELGHARAQREYMAIIIALILSSGGSIRVKQNLLERISKNSIVQTVPDIAKDELIWSAWL